MKRRLPLFWAMLCGNARNEKFPRRRLTPCIETDVPTAPKVTVPVTATKTRQFYDSLLDQIATRHSRLKPGSPAPRAGGGVAGFLRHDACGASRVDPGRMAGPLSEIRNLRFVSPESGHGEFTLQSRRRRSSSPAGHHRVREPERNLRNVAGAYGNADNLVINGTSSPRKIPNGSTSASSSKTQMAGCSSSITLPSA